MFIIYTILTLITILIYIFFIISSEKKFNYLLKVKSGIIFIGGYFGGGKTRLLTRIGFLLNKEKDKNYFFISNFMNGYNFLQFSSFKDFCELLDDLLILGDYQNFNVEEKKEIEKNFNNYFEVSFKEFEKKYKYIPKKPCRFVVAGDEFHQYLYNRFAMKNFSGKNGKKLLKTIHQVRHYNTLLILTTQNVYKIDEALRSLCSYVIYTNSSPLLFIYNIFNFDNKKEVQDDLVRVNKVPLFHFNLFNLNIILNKINGKLNKICFYFINKYNKIFKKNVIYKEKVFLKNFKVLNFYSKFNVKIDKDIYKQGDLFVKLNDYYKKIEKDLTK